MHIIIFQELKCLYVIVLKINGIAKVQLNDWNFQHQNQ